MEQEKLIEQCEEWAKKNLAEDFEFRKYQLESIVAILMNVLGGTKTQAMNAPTGSGKSLTAIIAAGVLWEYYKKKSYILVSDLSLFEQYENDIAFYNLPWGHLKGKDNYVCSRNSNIVSCGECALNMVSINTLGDEAEACKRGYDCAKDCIYVKMRNLAQQAPVTIMTYQLYLIQRNYVSDMMDGLQQDPPFPDRELVICDEAHKLPDIVQTHFAPRVPTKEPEFMKTLNEYARKHNLPVPNSKQVTTIAANLAATMDHSKVLSIMHRYEKLLAEYTDINLEVRKYAKASKKFKPLAKYLAAGNVARECRCKFGDFFALVDELGESIAVKTDGEDETVINCTYEGQMITKYFHNVSQCELLMSATLGNLQMYRECIGLKKCDNAQYKGLNIPSTFDFSKSPIFYSDKNPMSYKEKDKSIGPICKQIIAICNHYRNVRGIIQTGNYENTTKLMDRLPADIKQRVIKYSTAKEKNYAIEKFLKSSNGILVGPTLLEGLNFDGDKCRFSICMKLPYASLANNLISTKMKLMPDWYNYDVISKCEQGFGRGVRFNGDWCVNYILDGCVINLVKYNSHLFSKDTIKRFKLIGANKMAY